MKIYKLASTLLLIPLLTACFPSESEPEWSQHFDTSSTQGSTLLNRGDGSFTHLYSDGSIVTSEAYRYSGEKIGDSILLPEESAPTIFNQASGISYRVDKRDNGLSLTKFNHDLAIEWQRDETFSDDLLGDFSTAQVDLSFTDDDSLLIIQAEKLIVLLDTDGNIVSSKLFENGDTFVDFHFSGFSYDGQVAIAQCENFYSSCHYKIFDSEFNETHAFEYSHSSLKFANSGFYSSSNLGVCRLSLQAEPEWCKNFSIFTNAKTVIYDDGNTYYLQISKYGEDQRKVVIEKINSEGQSEWLYEYANAVDVSELTLTSQGVSFVHTTKTQEIPLINFDFLFGGTQLNTYMQLTSIAFDGSVKNKIVMNHAEHRQYIQSITPFIGINFYNEAGTISIYDYLLTDSNVIIASQFSSEKSYSDSVLTTISDSYVDLSSFIAQ